MMRASRGRRLPPIVLTAAAGLALALAAHPPIAAQRPVFSARVDTVRVDVEVKRHGEVVPRLTAADFEVLDNGVRQKVEIVAPLAFPVSAVLALDTSSSLNEKERAHLTSAGTRVIDALKPGESAALLTFSGRIDIRSPFTADAARLRALVAGPVTSGDTALHDAAHAAMLLGTSAPGRPLVILFSDGADTASFLTEEAVVETAQRTGSVVCVVTLGSENRLLKQMTDITGGLYVRERSLDRVGARFAEILESFRNRYLVSFVPTGVDKAGWHKLTVRVKGGGDVRARSGYWSGS